MASHDILCLFILVSFLSVATTEAQDDPFYLYQYCSSNRTTANTSFQFDLTTLLSYLSSNATGSAQYYNTTFTGHNPSDTIYGLFMCRGDVPSQLCQKCVVNATQQLSSECSQSKEGVIWYDECMIWYSTTPFFSTVTTTPSFDLLNTANVTNPKTFMRLLFSTMNETADEAARAPIGEKKFAIKEATISRFETLYCLAQCTPDLSPHDCRTCLNGVTGEIAGCCEGRVGGRVLTPSCNIRFELYPFYRSIVPSPSQAASLVPITKNTSHADSKFSENPVYLSHNCSTKNNFTANSTLQLHLNTLFSYLSSNATSGNLFHKVDVDGIYGLFMCRGDIPSHLCEQCVHNATRKISSECGLLQDAIIWYSQCMFRYSYRNFFYTMNKYPMYSELNITSSPNEKGNLFTFALSNTLSKVFIEAGDSDARYGTRSLKLNDLQIIYTLGQCTQDLSSDDCKGCLGDLMGTAIPWSHLGSIGGRVLYPSCNMRFESFQFYRDNDEASRPRTSSPPDKRKHRSRTIVLIVVPIFVSVILFSVGYYLLKRKVRKSFKTILSQHFGYESATLEPLQYNFPIIEAATNNFSKENCIGKGGFGEVYKGILPDGRQIAVKRLSKHSRQGANEFKNEVLLIAKLQHRNLVTFIGFCLQEQEKILIYEFVPNKSLDYFLFDSHRERSLSWFERYDIIRGIAQGILYLHEHSRLKVIHRDLKPSNILLNENMIPKISDFGLARIVEINEDRGRTKKIVGTLGYMSPEYAMLGQFSEKSDVYSFGVMILEIVSGRKIVNSFELRIGDNLLSHVWRQWMDEAPLSILDTDIKGSYVENEVIRCIQTGLLCVQQHPNDRPTMVAVVSYLTNHLIELPTPHEPAFFLPDRMVEREITKDVSSSQSINEMSISESIPR